MLNPIFYLKRRKLFSLFKGGLPQDLSKDLKRVVDTLMLQDKSKDLMFSGLYGKRKSKWVLPHGEEIFIPYRVYFKITPLKKVTDLTKRQRQIYYAILSRSFNGHVREEAIKNLLKMDGEAWVKAYVIEICGEYVSQILNNVYQVLSQRDCTDYKRLCQLNFKAVCLKHAHMISFWAAYHRYDFYRYKSWIGKRLFKDCFGYGKTGQKKISLN